MRSKSELPSDTSKRQRYPWIVAQNVRRVCLFIVEGIHAAALRTAESVCLRVNLRPQVTQAGKSSRLLFLYNKLVLPNFNHPRIAGASCQRGKCYTAENQIISCHYRILQCCPRIVRMFGASDKVSGGPYPPLNTILIAFTLPRSPHLLHRAADVT